MMNITKQELQDIQIPYNNVLIKLEREHDEYISQGGMRLKIDPSYNPGYHAPQKGIVAAVPKNLRFGKKLRNSLEWDTDVEIQKGDEVFFSYLSYMNAMGIDSSYSRYLKHNDDVYIFVSYENLYVAKRGDEVIMLNGYILVEPLPDDSLDGVKIQLPEQVKNRFQPTMGVVAYAGKPVKAYRNKNYFDNMDIQVGNVVVFQKHNDIPLEADIHASFEGKKKFYRMQRKDVLGVVEEKGVA